MSLQTGQIIEGKYRIVRLLGEGGMGAVYEGENVRINRRVAIKVLHAGFTENKEDTQRFALEALRDFLVLGEARVQHLDGHTAIDADVLALVDRAHSAFAQQADDAI